MKHSWRAIGAGALTALMVANCLPVTAMAQNVQQMAALAVVQDAGGFTIENGMLTAYTGDEKNVTIPDGVTVIGNGTDAVFSSAVESVIIPAGVTEIAANAFYGCTGLKGVTFAGDSQLTKIGQEAFYAVNQLQELAIPEGVTEIGTYAFAAMSALETITLPSTLATVCDGAWFGNLFARGTNGGAPEALTGVNIAEGNSNYISCDGAVYSADGKTLLYCPAQKSAIQWNGTVETIGSYAFNKSAMQTIALPDTLRTIDDYAFYSSKLTALSIPASVESIGKSAFFINMNLKSVAFTEGLKTIGDSAFSECGFSDGVVLEIPASVTSVGGSAFDCLGDMGAASIKVLGNTTELGGSFIPYYNSITVYGKNGSTAEQYVTAKKTEKGENCKLTFQTDGFVEPTGISLDRGAVTLSRTGSVQLIATLTPEGAQGAVAWSSSAPSGPPSAAPAL